MPASKRSTAAIRDVARTSYGHGELLPGQQEAVRAVLEDRDVLLVAPTGAGKSLTYQIAGTLIDGCTVVISPLLALQADQIRSLAEIDGAPPGARISSAETETQRQAALEGARSGKVEFLFLAPEQLANPDLVAELAQLRPRLVAVDEAHCVSTWGHDFRPDYARLGELIEQLGSPRILAMTATAAPPVRADIVDRLRMRRPVEVVTGFARDNIALQVDRFADAADQRRAVVDLAAHEAGPGIVYCRTRASTDEYAAAIEARGVRVTSYHAGMGRRRRQEAHKRFRDGSADVMVATSAFGMGIDKPDIRYVLHAQVPDSIDTYYQEVGRAGRDGGAARARLLYRAEDLALVRFFGSGIPSRDHVAEVVAALVELGPGDRSGLGEATGLGPRRLGRILNLVDQVTQSGAAPLAGTDALVDAVTGRATAHRALERSRVEMMRAYAETRRCRMDFVLGYFGDLSRGPCGSCDNCRDQGGAAVRTQHVGAPDGIETQSRVRHPKFGAGVVTDLEEDRLTVLFDETGYRQLSRAVVESGGLLEPGT